MCKTSHLQLMKIWPPAGEISHQNYFTVIILNKYRKMSHLYEALGAHFECSSISWSSMISSIFMCFGVLEVLHDNVGVWLRLPSTVTAVLGQR